MTTHLRTRTIQVGALLALVGGMVAVASSPALADDPNVQIISVSSTDLPAGGRTTMTYSVTNTNQVPPQGTTIRVTVNGNGMSCSGDCSPQATLQPNQPKQFTVQLTAPNVDAGQTKNFTVQVNASAGGNDNGNATQNFTVRGADKPKTVTQVIGRVKDQDGKPVVGANVGVRDSQGHSYTTTTNDDGRFSFRSSDQQPILAGTLSVGAVKQGFSQVTVSVQGTAGKVLNVPLTLEGTAVTASATPSPTVTASAPATDEATDPATDAASAPAVDANAASKSSGSSSLLFIILGGLLVAAGVGAIVLVLMRRKNNGDDPDDPDGVNAPGGGMVPPSRGAYHDATRVAAPVGGRNDATMVAGRGPSIADAPTMMQQSVPVDDEFPDPYGAPAPRAGYGAGGYDATSQYGGGGGYGGATVPAQAGGYDPGPATQFGQPPIDENDPYATFGAAAGAGGAGGGYGGAPQRFDEPTGMYRPESGGGYGQDQGYGGYQGAQAPEQPGSYGANGYGGEPEYPATRRGEQTGGYPGGSYAGDRDAGYGQEPPAGQGGYGSWGAPAGGIDSGNGYGPAGGGTRGADSRSADSRGAEYGGSSGTYGGSAGTYGGSSYGAPAGGGNAYGGEQEEYDQRGAYGGRSDSYGQGGAGGYGGGARDAGGGTRDAGGYAQDGGGYGGGSGYGGADRGGYRDQGGYDQRGGYDAEPAGGYGGSGAGGGGAGGGGAGGGYYGADGEQRGGRHGGQSRPPQESTHPGQRRPLDWLDD